MASGPVVGPSFRRSKRGRRRLWAAATGLGLLVILWEVGHLAYGDLVLPSPLAALDALIALARDGRLAPAVALTAVNALGGFAVAAVAGLGLGLIAGLSPTLEAMLRPLSLFLLGVPAIAWVVLALLWFGGTLAVSFTVAVTTFPVIFAAAVEGVRSLDGALGTMARSFRVPPATLVADVYLPHMLSYLLPAVATALAMSWKVAVMAELLAGAGGIGDGLAAARAEVDTATTLAWIVAVVALLLAVDALVLAPLRRRAEIWRADLPERRT